MSKKIIDDGSAAKDKLIYLKPADLVGDLCKYLIDGFSYEKLVQTYGFQGRVAAVFVAIITVLACVLWIAKELFLIAFFFCWILAEIALSPINVIIWFATGEWCGVILARIRWVALILASSAFVKQGGTFIDRKAMDKRDKEVADLLNTTTTEIVRKAKYN